MHHKSTLEERGPRLLIFSGAGISADSGISTFRDSDGLWENHSVDVVANYRTWKANFETVHAFYNARRAAVAAAQPNAMHHAIAEWQRRYPTTLLTQNIDDLLERAGCTDVVHLHGRVNAMSCQACGHTFDVDPGTPWVASTGTCPKCPCRRGIKPGVVFFEEDAPLYGRMYREFRDLRPGDVLMVLGTSGKVIDIGAYARDSAAYTILSNRESTDELWSPWSPVARDEQFNLALHGRAVEMAPRLDHILRGILGDGRTASNEEDHG
jgi:NAD-dependent deacetylase